MCLRKWLAAKRRGLLGGDRLANGKVALTSHARLLATRWQYPAVLGGLDVRNEGKSCGVDEVRICQRDAVCIQRGELGSQHVGG